MKIAKNAKILRSLKNLDFGVLLSFIAEKIFEKNGSGLRVRPPFCRAFSGGEERCGALRHKEKGTGKILFFRNIVKRLEKKSYLE